MAMAAMRISGGSATLSANELNNGITCSERMVQLVYLKLKDVPLQLLVPLCLKKNPSDV